MSIDTSVHHDAHGHEGHHDGPDVVDRRNRMALWLFIGGDIITLSALFFTYLYLRGVNTGGHWMSMYGYVGHTYGWFENALNSAAGLPAATLIHVKPLSASLNWLGSGVTVLSALVMWFAEHKLRVGKNTRAFAFWSFVATLVVLAAFVVSVIQLRHIPQIFVAHNDSQLMAYTTYDSAMMAIIAIAAAHYVVLAFLGLGLTIRGSRGVVNAQNWYHSRLIRIFWVWVAISAVITSLLTTTINTIHH